VEHQLRQSGVHQRLSCPTTARDADAGAWTADRQLQRSAPAQSGALNGQYPSGTIDWGTNAWYLSSPWRQFTTNSIGFNGAGPTSATFRLVAPRRLVGLDAYNGGPTPSTVTLQRDAQPLVQIVLAAGQLATTTTNWPAATCSVVRVGSTNGWNTNFDNLVFES
jgi:hypothetical protein